MIALVVASAAAAVLLGHAASWPAVLLMPTLAVVLAWPTAHKAYRRRRLARITGELRSLEARTAG